MSASVQSTHESGRPLLGIVGPCAAGKSTLMNGLKAVGIASRQIAQEHSYVQDMWQRLTNPIFLVFLDVSFENTLLRNRLDWQEKDYQEQLKRLSHARTHADIVIDTNDLSPMQVLAQVMEFLIQHQP